MMALKVITRSSLQHIPFSADCFAHSSEEIHLRVRSARGEVERVTLWIGDPYDWEIGGLDGGNLGGGNAYNWTGGHPVEMKLEGETEHHDSWFAAVRPLKKRARYGFILHARNGSETVLLGERRIVDVSESTVRRKALSEISNLFCFPYLHASDVIDIPSWVSETFWYQIFPDRFCVGRPENSLPDVKAWGGDVDQHCFMGGDLWGVIEKLDYLESLGVNGIYLTPIFTAVSNHRYDTTDYFNVDPRLGGNEAFQVLVESVHERGMRIMLDAVFNHVGHEHAIWKDVVEKGESSIYADWFHIKRFPVYPPGRKETWDKWDLNYETFGTSFEMVKFNTANAACREYLLNIARHWVSNFCIDGWRLDVANEVDHEFWRAFRKVVRAENPECYILAEIWHDGMPWLHGDQFDALMNYPLTQTIIDYFALGSIGKVEFMRSVTRSYLAYPRAIGAAMFNLLDSHDTSRILFLCGEDSRKAKLAYLFMITQPGSPCIFYGGEIGLSGGRIGISEANRCCMVWDSAKQNHALFQFIAELASLRKKYADFRSSGIEWLETAAMDCIAFRRGSIIVCLNNGGEIRTMVVEGEEICLGPYGYRLFLEGRTIFHSGSVFVR